MEMTYIFQGIAEAPRSIIAEKMLPEIDTVISELHKFDDGDERAKESKYSKGKGGYWDDYCLAMFLRGVCLRYVAYPVSVLVLRSRYIIKRCIGSRRRDRPKGSRHDREGGG
jgi:hypothetical protein